MLAAAVGGAGNRKSGDEQTMRLIARRFGIGSVAALAVVVATGLRLVGPRGLASIVFAIIVLKGSALTHVDLVVATVLTTVGMSVNAHGLHPPCRSRTHNARWPPETSRRRWRARHPRASLATSRHCYRPGVRVTLRHVL